MGQSLPPGFASGRFDFAIDCVEDVDFPGLGRYLDGYFCMEEYWTVQANLAAA